jgi:hypothetical protein
MAMTSNVSRGTFRAKFVFYWDLSGGDNAEAYFNTPDGTTISQKALMAKGIPIPLMPDYWTWRELVDRGVRCTHCWSGVTCSHRIVETKGAHNV